jgi:enoyl-CoA hydratase/carnithine racemase
MATPEELEAMFPVTWGFERTDDGILTVSWKMPRFSSQDQDPSSRDPSKFLFPDGEGPGIQVAEDVWNEIGRDGENKVVVLTGHDGTFYDPPAGSSGLGPPPWNAALWHSVLYRVPRSMQAFLDIPTLLIGAANGPARIHAEYLLLCDIVVAAESAVFQDLPHFVTNSVPGDGVNIVWPLLLGWNRGRDFLLSGTTLTAEEAKELGLVREVVPDDELLPRCHEIARHLLRQDETTLRYTAPVLRHHLKLQVMEYLQHSMALEGILKVERAPRSGG